MRTGGGDRWEQAGRPRFAPPFRGAKRSHDVAPRGWLNISLLLLCATIGCGYSLVGKGITTDPSIKRIGVPLFKDRTGRAGLDQKLTNKVIAELLRRGRFDVVPEAEGVDALVEGELLTYNTAPIGFSSDGTTTQASRFAVTVTARIVYRKVGDKEPIWANENFLVREEAEISDDSSAYFDREEQTWERLGESFARNLVAAMLEAF